ncbi:hypothetical protein AMTRI_Chr09g40620 [Amborella trichopoda]
MEYYLDSGDMKHGFAGIAIIGVHQSHQDYLERENKAQSERLSLSSPSVK